MALQINQIANGFGSFIQGRFERFAGLGGLTDSPRHVIEIDGNAASTLLGIGVPITDTGAVASGTVLSGGATGLTGLLSLILNKIISGLSVTLPPDSRVALQSISVGAVSGSVPAYAIPISGGQNTLRIKLTNLTQTGATLAIKSSTDGGTTWDNKNASSQSSTYPIQSIAVDGPLSIDVAGCTNIALFVTTAGSGAMLVSYSASTATGLVGLSASLPSGSNNIGSTNPTPTALKNSSGVLSCSATPGTATIVVPFSATRQWVIVSSRTTGVETIDLGSSNVTTGGGIPVYANGGFLFAGPGALGPIYAVSPVASTPVSYVEA